MNKIFINTCNDDLTIVLKTDKTLVCKSIQSSAHHNELMLVKIDEILKENSLKIQNVGEFGVVIGPGSFTGVRVGISTIKAFRDALNVRAKSVNNLELLFALSKKQNKDINIVAIAGSRDCFFVARELFGKVYIYERVLNGAELNKLAGSNKVGMYKPHEDVNSFVVQFDPTVMAELFEKSKDENLSPVYYQLSQAEKDKLNRLKTEIVQAKTSDVETIYNIQSKAISTNIISAADIKSMLADGNHKAYLIKADEQVAGYLIAEFTDEANIVSAAIDKDYRNLGYASKLIEHLKLEAKSMKIERLSLEVSTNNPTAYLLYEKLGFKTRRVRKNYYSDGADCIEMTLEI